MVGPIPYPWCFLHPWQVRCREQPRPARAECQISLVAVRRARSICRLGIRGCSGNFMAQAYPLPGFGNGLAVSSYLPPAAAVQTSSPARGRLSPPIYITKPSSASSSGYQKFRRSNNSITHTAETEERAAGPGRGPRRPRTSTVAASSSRGRTMLPGVELARRRRVHYHGDVASAAGTGEHVHHHYAPAPAAGPALAARIRLEEKLRGAALPSTAPSRSVASRFLFLPCFSDAWFR